MLALIAAVAKNNCIGKNNKLPWHLPEDLAYFKKTTAGKTVLMGRKTFESIFAYLGRPLPNRKNIVITRNAGYKAPTGVLVYNDLAEALQKHKNEDVFVIGGAAIYAQTVKKADKLYLTEVDQAVDGDAYFPEVDKNIWKEKSRLKQNGFSFVVYVKK